jgi:hypothetical protein
MKNILAKICGLLMILKLMSCGDVKGILDTQKSFDENVNKYEKVVMDIKQHRDKLLKTEKSTRMLKSYNDVLSKLGKEFGNPEILSSNPLVISFTPHTYSYVIWFAETSKSVEFMFSNPIEVGQEYKVDHLKGKWYFVTTDLDSSSPLF